MTEASVQAHHSGRGVSRLLADCRGQDLLEYALLTALIGIVSVAVWAAIEGRLGESYQGFDGRTQQVWEPPDPAAP